jgi:hypothetical protein
MVKGQLLNVYKNLAGMMASSSSSQVWALLHHELFSFFQLNAGLSLDYHFIAFFFVLVAPFFIGLIVFLSFKAAILLP